MTNNNEAAIATAAASAAATAVAGAAGLSSEAKCPKFNGESERESDVIIFCHEVDIWKEKVNVDDKKAAAWVVSNFEGNAKRWYFLLLEQGNKNIEAWPTLKDELIERFAVHKDYSCRELKCMKDESLPSFLQRIDESLAAKYKAMPADIRKAKAFKILENKERISLFMKGIPGSISKRLIASGEHVCADEYGYENFNMKKLLNKAKQFQQADEFADGPKKPDVKKEVASVGFLSDADLNNMSIDQVRNEYARLRQATSNPRQPNQGNSGNTRPVEQACFHCGIKNFHRASECRTKLARGISNPGWTRRLQPF